MELESKETANKRNPCRPTEVRRPESMSCDICLTRDHWSSSCPYRIEYPPGATIGPLAEIVCLCCGEVMTHPGVLPHPGVPGLHRKAISDLKRGFTYPSIEEQLREHRI